MQAAQERESELARHLDQLAKALEDATREKTMLGRRVRASVEPDAGRARGQGFEGERVDTQREFALRASVVALNASLVSYQEDFKLLEEELETQRGVAAELQAIVKNALPSAGGGEGWGDEARARFDAAVRVLLEGEAGNVEDGSRDRDRGTRRSSASSSSSPTESDTAAGGTGGGHKEEMSRLKISLASSEWALVRAGVAWEGLAAQNARARELLSALLSINKPDDVQGRGQGRGRGVSRKVEEVERFLAMAPPTLPEALQGCMLAAEGGAADQACRPPGYVLGGEAAGAGAAGVDGEAALTRIHVEALEAENSNLNSAVLVLQQQVARQDEQLVELEDLLEKATEEHQAAEERERVSAERARTAAVLEQELLQLRDERAREQQDHARERKQQQALQVSRKGQSSGKGGEDQRDLGQDTAGTRRRSSRRPSWSWFRQRLETAAVKLIAVRVRVTQALAGAYGHGSEDRDEDVGAGSQGTEGQMASETLVAVGKGLLAELEEALALVGEAEQEVERQAGGMSQSGGSGGEGDEEGGEGVSEEKSGEGGYTFAELESKYVEVKDALFLEQQWSQRREASLKTQVEDLRAMLTASKGVDEFVAANGVERRAESTAPSLAKDLHRVSQQRLGEEQLEGVEVHGEERASCPNASTEAVTPATDKSSFVRANMSQDRRPAEATEDDLTSTLGYSSSQSPLRMHSPLRTHARDARARLFEKPGSPPPPTASPPKLRLLTETLHSDGGACNDQGRDVDGLRPTSNLPGASVDLCLAVSSDAGTGPAERLIELEKEVERLRRALDEESALSEWYSAQLDEAHKQAHVATSDATILENALEVMVHEGAMKEHPATLASQRQAPAAGSAELLSQAQELRARQLGVEEDNQVLRLHLSSKRQEVTALQAQAQRLQAECDVAKNAKAEVQEQLQQERCVVEDLRMQVDALERVVEGLSAGLNDNQTASAPSGEKSPERQAAAGGVQQVGGERGGGLHLAARAAARSKERESLDRSKNEERGSGRDGEQVTGRDGRSSLPAAAAQPDSILMQQGMAQWLGLQGEELVAGGKGDGTGRVKQVPIDAAAAVWEVAEAADVEEQERTADSRRRKAEQAAAELATLGSYRDAAAAAAAEVIALKKRAQDTAEEMDALKDKLRRAEARVAAHAASFAAGHQHSRARRRGARGRQAPLHLSRLGRSLSPASLQRVAGGGEEASGWRAANLSTAAVEGPSGTTMTVTAAAALGAPSIVDDGGRGVEGVSTSRRLKELQRALETKKSLIEQLQARVHAAEGREGVALAAFDSLRSIVENLEAQATRSKREAADARAARTRDNEASADAARGLAAQLAAADAARVKAEEIARKARKAAHGLSAEVEDLRIQASKWQVACEFAQQLQEQSAAAAAAAEARMLAAECTRAHRGGAADDACGESDGEQMNALFERCAGSVQGLWDVLDGIGARLEQETVTRARLAAAGAGARSQLMAMQDDASAKERAREREREGERQREGEAERERERLQRDLDTSTQVNREANERAVAVCNQYAARMSALECTLAWAKDQALHLVRDGCELQGEMDELSAEISSGVQSVAVARQLESERVAALEAWGGDLEFRLEECAARAEAAEEETARVKLLLEETMSRVAQDKDEAERERASERESAGEMLEHRSEALQRVIDQLRDEVAVAAEREAAAQAQHTMLEGLMVREQERMLALHLQHAEELSQTGLVSEALLESCAGLEGAVGALVDGVATAAAAVHAEAQQKAQMVEKTHETETGAWAQERELMGRQQQICEARALASEWREQDLQKRVQRLCTALCADVGGAVHHADEIARASHASVHDQLSVHETVLMLRAKVTELETSKQEAQTKLAQVCRKSAQVVEELRMDVLKAESRATRSESVRKPHATSPSPSPPSRGRQTETWASGSSGGSESSPSSRTPTPSPRRACRSGARGTTRALSQGAGAADSVLERLRKSRFMLAENEVL